MNCQGHMGSDLRNYTGLTNQEIGDIVGMPYPAASKAGLTIERLMEEDKKLQRTITKIVFSFHRVTENV